VRTAADTESVTVRATATTALVGLICVGDENDPPMARTTSILPAPATRLSTMNPTIRIITRGSNGELRSKDYEKHDTVLKMHTQIGVDDCSTDLTLRGMPVFRGLIGPMPEGKGIVRYETPEVFETLTKEWSTSTASHSRRRRSTTS
jgi:hypothetical protein